MSSQRLDRDRVIAAAAAIVDSDGWRALTMSALAKELGIKVPSLYNHVSNLEALRGELQNRTLREIGERLNHTAMGRTGEHAMRALAATFRAYALEHPGRYDLATQAPIDREGFADVSVAAGEALFAVIRSYGIVDADALELQLSAFAALHGALVLENAGFFPDTIDAEPIYGLVLDQVLDLLARRAHELEVAS